MRADIALPPLPATLADGGIALRPEGEGDRAFLLGLYAAQRAPELACVPWSPIEKARFLADQFALQSAHYRTHHADDDRWIVTRAGAPIGRLYLARRPRWWGLLEIGLDPAEQSRGVGTELIGWAIEAAAAARAGVELQVVPDNLRAIALYRRLGFADAPPGGPGRLRMRRPR